MSNSINLIKKVTIQDLPALVVRLIALISKPMWVDHTTSSMRVASHPVTVAAGGIALGGVATGGVADYGTYVYPITRDLVGASWGMTVGRLIN